MSQATESKTNYLVENSLEFHAILLRQHEASLNASALTNYKAENDRTEWLVGGRLVAVSEGQIGSRLRYWAVVPLTPAQHRLATDQLSNNDVAGETEIVDLLWKEGRIPSADGHALLPELNRCLVNPMYEPLQAVYS
jgi:hypothetical protein